MRVQIRKRFRDAETMQLMLPGRHAEYDTDRAKKLARSGYVLLLDAEEDKSDQSLEPIADDISENIEKNESEQEGEKVEIIVPSKKESGKIPGKRGRKPNK